MRFGAPFSISKYQQNKYLYFHVKTRMKLYFGELPLKRLNLSNQVTPYPKFFAQGYLAQADTFFSLHEFYFPHDFPQLLTTVSCLVPS